MAFRTVLLAVAFLTLALVMGSGIAAAKGTTYLLTGGELGSHAYLLESYIPDADGTDWSPGVEGVQVDPPQTLPSLAYDLYRRYGVFAVPYEASVRGPELRYYPSLGLVQSLWSERWYRPPAETVSYLDKAIVDALARMEAGELDDNAFVADLRGRRMHQVIYSVWPYSPNDVISGNEVGECGGCLGQVPSVETFVFEQLVETVSHPRMYDSSAEPAYKIEYHGWFGGAGIGGVFGFYRPPVDGQPGRFWMSGYVHDQDKPYYETTAGFDAAIEAALAGPYARLSETSAIGTDDSGFRATAAGAALLAAVLGVGVVGGFARRRI